MSRLTNVKSDLINRDAVRQTYRGNKPYQEQFRRSTEKAIADVTVKPESEFVRPYITNALPEDQGGGGYEQMEYEQLPEPSFPPLPPQTTPDVDWGTVPIATAETVFTITTPIFVPVAGTYGSAQTVYIITVPADADIYYTIDGTEPTENKTKYTPAGIVLSSNTTLKAKAFKDGWNPSETKTGIYNISILPATVTAMGPSYWTINRGSYAGGKYTSDTQGFGPFENTRIDLTPTGSWYVGYQPASVVVTWELVAGGVNPLEFKIGSTGAGDAGGDSNYTSGDSLVLSWGVGDEINQLQLNEDQPISGNQFRITNIVFTT